MRQGHIVDVGRRAHQGMHQARVGIRPDMGPHAEVPLVALPGLMHLGITLAAAVLGRTGRGDQRGIDRRAAFEHQAFVGQHALTVVSIWGARSCALSRWRKRRMLTRSGIQAVLAKPQKSRYSGVSNKASSMAMSLKPNHCCKK